MTARKRSVARTQGAGAARAVAVSKPVNYWEYVRVEELLALQGGVERDERDLANDEVLFITVHQVYELWFKLVLRELSSIRDLFQAPRVAEQELSGVARGLRRVITVLRQAVAHFEVIETLTTRDYLDFRDKLFPASGFQSAQLRQIEILLGLPDSERINLGLEESFMQALRAHDGSPSPALERVLAQKQCATLRDVIDEWLWRAPIDGVAPGDPRAREALDGFVEAYLRAHAAAVDVTCALALERSLVEADRARLRGRYEDEKRAVRAFFEPAEAAGGERRRRIRTALVFIATYRELPLLAWPREILDLLIEMEQVFTIWRQRHARMVEREIGRRTGTGGSAGVEYLDATALKYRVFRDLWAVRTLQIRLSAAPKLRNPGFYGFLHG
jgi:tryptophan 2,3-dioxygenase